MKQVFFICFCKTDENILFLNLSTEISKYNKTLELHKEQFIHSEDKSVYQDVMYIFTS